MHFTLFVDGYFCNPYDASCYVALEEKQQPYSIARAMLRDNQGFPPMMTERTPIARVPALSHGEFWITESSAIVEYLEDVLPPPSYERLLPADPRERARARQVMAWLRIDLRALRAERRFYQSIYTELAVEPLSPLAALEARELVDVVLRLELEGQLATWNIMHADLALTLRRLRPDDIEIPPAVQRFSDEVHARPSVRGYIAHQRPPHPPP